MGILGALVTLFGIASLLSTLWLVFIAFKRGFWWGVGVFFLSPLSAIIFAIKYWKEAKSPFLTYIFTSTVFTALLIYMFVSMGAFELMRKAQQQIQVDESSNKEITQIIDSLVKHTESSEMVKEQENREMQEILDLAERTAPPPIEEKKVKTQTSAPQQTPEDYKSIAVTNAGNYIGNNMRVVGRNGIEHTGILKNVDPDRLIFERLLHGGKFAFELKTADIMSLQVYR
jgi:hypothetical protein